MELVHKQIKQRNGESSRKNGMSWREVDPEVVLTWVRVCQDARQIASGLPIMFSPLAQYHATEAVECRKGHEALSENKAKIQWLILVNHHFPYEKWQLFWIYSIFCHWTWKNLDQSTHSFGASKHGVPWELDGPFPKPEPSWKLAQAWRRWRESSVGET